MTEERKIHTPAERKTLIREMRSYIMTRIFDWDLQDLELVKAAVTQIESKDYYQEPAAEFIRSILLGLAIGDPITPLDIQDDLINFTNHFGSIAKGAYGFVKKYPELAGGAQ